MGTVAGIGKNPVFASDHEGFDRTFGTVVIDAQVAIVDIADQFGPLPQGVSDGCPDVGLGRYLQRGLIQPTLQLVQ